MRLRLFPTDFAGSKNSDREAYHVEEARIRIDSSCINREMGTLARTVDIFCYDIIDRGGNFVNNCDFNSTDPFPKYNC